MFTSSCSSYMYSLILPTVVIFQVLIKKFNLFNSSLNPLSFDRLQPTSKINKKGASKKYFNFFSPLCFYLFSLSVSFLKDFKTSQFFICISSIQQANLFLYLEPLELIEVSMKLSFNKKLTAVMTITKRLRYFRFQNYLGNFMNFI